MTQLPLTIRRDGIQLDLLGFHRVHELPIAVLHTNGLVVVATATLEGRVEVDRVDPRVRHYGHGVQPSHESGVDVLSGGTTQCARTNVRASLSAADFAQVEGEIVIVSVTYRLRKDVALRIEQNALGRSDSPRTGVQINKTLIRKTVLHSPDQRASVSLVSTLHRTRSGDRITNHIRRHSLTALSHRTQSSVQRHRDLLVGLGPLRTPVAIGSAPNTGADDLFGLRPHVTDHLPRSKSSLHLRVAVTQSKTVSKSRSITDVTHPARSTR